MKYILLLLVFLLSSLNAISTSSENEIWLNNYSGDINKKYKIGMSLIYYKDRVEGVYFYNSQLKDITIKSKVLSDNKIVLNEYDKEGNITATFDGKFIAYANEDPRKRYGASTNKLQKEIIVGTWFNNKNKFPFYVALNSATFKEKGQGRYAVAGALSDDVIEKNAQLFHKSVIKNDKQTVSKLISYPIDVYINKKEKRIKTQKEFLKYYDEIFSLEFKEAISKIVPHNMFVKYTGIMLGRGEIWFGSDGKVISINNY